MHHPDVLWGQDTVSGHKLPGLGGFSAAGADKGTGTVQAERSARSAVTSRLALETTQSYF